MVRLLRAAPAALLVSQYSDDGVPRDYFAQLATNNEKDISPLSFHEDSSWPEVEPEGWEFQRPTREATQQHSFVQVETASSGIPAEPDSAGEGQSRIGRFVSRIGRIFSRRSRSVESRGAVGGATAEDPLEGTSAGGQAPLDAQERLVRLVDENTKAMCEEKRSASRDVQLVESAITNVLRHRRRGGYVLKLLNVKDLTNDVMLLDKCTIRIFGLSEVLENSLTFNIEIVNDSKAVAIGGKFFGMKVYFENMTGRLNSPQSAGESVGHSLSLVSRIDSELNSTKLYRQYAKGYAWTQILMNNKANWHVPLLSARIKENRRAVVHDSVLMLNNVLLYIPVAGHIDALDYRARVTPLRDPLMQSQREAMCTSLISAAAMLNSLGYVHFNINPESVAVRTDGLALLAKFEYMEREGSRQMCAFQQKLDFMAPEVVACNRRGDVLTLKAAMDAWSVGMSCYSILTGGGFPFPVPEGSSIQNVLMDLHSSGVGADMLYRLRRALIELGTTSKLASVVSLLLSPRASRRASLDAALDFIESRRSSSASEGRV